MEVCEEIGGQLCGDVSDEDLSNRVGVAFGANFDLLSEVFEVRSLEVVFRFLEDSEVVIYKRLRFSTGEADGGGVAKAVQGVELGVVPVV